MSQTPVAISPKDITANRQVDALLEEVGIRRDGNLDYTCGIFDENEELAATGSCFGNTIRCLAVSADHQGEGLLNTILSHLMEVQSARGNAQLFLYTKPASAKFMESLGFYEIARVPGKLVFMENRRGGFHKFCQSLERRSASRVAGIVMNANPFTRGHQYLVEKAAAENDLVHLFVLSEEAGPIPFAVRKRLVVAGTAHLSNVIVHDSGPYIISSATFPSYFLKDGDTVIRTQAELDLQVFGEIARALGIQRRYVGEEKHSHVTALYNGVMQEKLPQLGLECIEIPRLHTGDAVISASTVRQSIHDGCLDCIRDYLPESSYRFFQSPEAAEICRAIAAEENVIHY